MRITVLTFVFALLICGLHAQRVGLVLSGGGSAALAHIGVIRALEENQIPIDYVAGTSMGAFVGALYAMGYTPDQMDSLVTSKEFELAVDGTFESRYMYYFYRQDNSASIVSLKINNKFNVLSVLPTNLMKPTLMDLMLAESMSAPAALAEYDFDQLMVPFRCVAADIENRQQVVFKSGNLSEAVRASVTYPFYFEPVMVNGSMLFDGGLYNNFPSDVMYDDFLPDYIIGSNVTGNIPPPEMDDLLSQVKNMIMDKTMYDPICEYGVIIKSDLDIGTFDFSRNQEAIDHGYTQTLQLIDSIKADVQRTRSKEELQKLRSDFQSGLKPLQFNDIKVTGLKPNEAHYVDKIVGLRRKEDSISFDVIRNRFYRLIQNEKIRYAFPTATQNEKDDLYTLNLQVQKEKEIIVDFGGHISSKPVNTGFVGLRYNHLGKRSVSVQANSYFGRFYGSVASRINLEFPGKNMLVISPLFTLNRWDYFRSFANFFEESKPSFIIQNDWYAGLAATKPIGTNGILEIDGKYSRLLDQYYQNDLFTPTDTSDQTYFRNFTAGAKLEFSTLNKKQFATEGKFVDLKVRYITGKEETILGSTSFSGEEFNFDREWIQLEFEADGYFRVGKFFSPGLYFKALYSNRPLFSNYSATIISAPAFQPVPESRTFFQEEFRAHQYLAGGVKGLFNFTKNIHLRLEAYTFLPYQRILRDEMNMAVYGDPWERPYFMSSTSLVYHSPLGPLSFSANYYENRPVDNWSFLFSFGYVLFNKRAFE